LLFGAREIHGMSYRSLLTLGAVVLLVAAATSVDTQHVVWKPSWPVRLGIGSVGVLLALGALVIGRAARRGDRS
jgi:hypothetical protein